MKDKAAKLGILGRVFGPASENDKTQLKTDGLNLQPALRQIGSTECPVCKHEVAVFLTKNNRPFINCGFCSARIFYNGLESMKRLKKKMRLVKEDQS